MNVDMPSNETKSEFFQTLNQTFQGELFDYFFKLRKLFSFLSFCPRKVKCQLKFPTDFLPMNRVILQEKRFGK